MLRTQHKGSFLLVEGATDARAFRHLTDHGACRVVIAHDRANALAAMEILAHGGFPGAAAVVDADFSRLEGTAAGSENVLLTDLHDLECMMAASPAFERLVGEFAAPEAVAEFEGACGCPIAEALVRRAMPLGYLRLVSQRERLSLRFDELPFQRFVVRETLQMDVDDLVVAVKDHSQLHGIASSLLVQHLTGVASAEHDPWQVVCGHDLLELLSFALRHTIASRNAHEVRREILERGLRLAYEAAQFMLSDLARAIRDWEDRNRPYRVLRAP